MELLKYTEMKIFSKIKEAWKELTSRSPYKPEVNQINWDDQQPAERPDPAPNYFVKPTLPLGFEEIQEQLEQLRKQLPDIKKNNKP
jgi:hypothetical protein